MVPFAFAFAACGGPGGETLASMESRQEGASADWGYTTVAELLDSMDETIASKQHAQMVVVATVMSVAPISSNKWVFDEKDDSSEQIVLPYGDEDSWIDIYHLSVEVKEILAVVDGVQQDPQKLTVGLALDPGLDAKQVEADLQELGEVVLFLENDSRVFAYDDELFGIVQSGAALGIMDNSGKIAFVSNDAQLDGPEDLTVETLRQMASK